MLARQYIEINNLKIAYSDIGKGDPVLFCARICKLLFHLGTV